MSYGDFNNKTSITESFDEDIPTFDDYLEAESKEEHMQNICATCPIDYKLTYCCHKNPETGESVILELDDGTKVQACPDFDEHVGCTMRYEDRPPACGAYDCPKINNMDMVDRMKYNRDNF